MHIAETFLAAGMSATCRCNPGVTSVAHPHPQDMLPISACESPGLVQSMSTLDPKFKKMRFKVLPRVLHGLEEETWALLKEARADYCTVIHYAGDLWTAPGTGDAFMCHIFQFVTPRCAAGLVVFDESKTADHQRQEIARCFEMWDVPLSQQGCITTDHESGISKGGQDLCCAEAGMLTMVAGCRAGLTVCSSHRNINYSRCRSRRNANGASQMTGW